MNRIKTKRKSKFVGVVQGIPKPTPENPIKITNSDHFTTVGGNKEEHAKITEIAIRIEEGLKKDRKQPHELHPNEFIDRLVNAIEKTD